MSDKETAPWIKKAAKRIQIDNSLTGGLSVDSIAQIIIAELAGECRAPAPQAICRNCELDFHGHCVNIAAPGECACSFCAAYPATPQVTPTQGNFCTGDQDCRHTCELELDREADGRWIAAYTRFPGVAAYGPSEEEAIRNAAKVLIESEQASPTPDKCPKCGSGIKGVFGRDCTQTWHSSWHSSAATPKGTK